MFKCIFYIAFLQFLVVGATVCQMSLRCGIPANYSPGGIKLMFWMFIVCAVAIFAKLVEAIYKNE